MPSIPPPGLSELTVTCRQCGSADMLRLDRKEYKCRHCGALTIISDSDAGRLEQLLNQFLARQRPAAVAPRRGLFVAVAAATLVLIVAGLALFSHTGRTPAGITTVDSYFAEQSVPNDQVVMSPLHWQPSESGGGGSYSGVLYNHSGYAIAPPSYTLNLFRNGMKGDSATSLALLATLEPGEYEPVLFRYDASQPGDRYEVEQPTHIMHSTFQVAVLPLDNPRLARTGYSYELTGVVRNTLKRPVQGSGELMLYGADGQIVASGVGSLAKLMPGEQTVLTLNAFFYHGVVPVIAYEYLLDAFYENNAQSVSFEDMQRLGKQTVPPRIHRVNLSAP